MNSCSSFSLQHFSGNQRKRHWCLNIPFMVFILLFFLAPQTVLSQDTSPEAGTTLLDTYREHRQSFLSRQHREEARYQGELSGIQQEIREINQLVSDKNREISLLQSKVSNIKATILGLNTVQTAISFFLFPLISTLSLLPAVAFGSWTMENLLLFIFIPITALNIYIYLLRREKPFFNKYKIVLTVLLVLLFTAFAGPLFAEEATKEEELAEQLDLAHKVLSMSDHQRFIAILEAKVHRRIELPYLSSGDPLLTVFREVTVDSAEYFFTLAALYSHEKRIGKAVDSISNIFQNMSPPKTVEHDKIIINSIKFLVQHQQTELAGKGVENLAGDVQSVPQLLNLETFLKNNGMQASADKILGYAIERARTVPDLIKLTTYFIEQGETEKGKESLQRAVQSAGKIEDLTLITRTAVENNNDGIIEAVINQLPAVVRKYSDHLEVIDIFLKNGRTEDAAAVFSNLISDTTRSTSNYRKRLLFLMDESLKRDLLEQTISAISKLSMYMGEEAYGYTVKPDGSLEVDQDLPDNSSVTLPLFYGLLNEKLKFNDKAEDVYMRAVLHSLGQILKSYGYQLPNSLNEYYLLGKSWINTDKEESLAKLDQVYTVLEELILRRLQDKNKNKLSEQQKDLRRLKEQHANRLQEVERLQKDVKSTRIQLLITLSGTFAVVIFLVGVIAGCAVKSYQYSKHLTQHKTFGFVTKFFETTGWVRIMTIIGGVSGLCQVLFAQLLQIIQKIHENGYIAASQVNFVDPQAIKRFETNEDNKS